MGINKISINFNLDFIEIIYLECYSRNIRKQRMQGKGSITLPQDLPWNLRYDFMQYTIFNSWMFKKGQKSNGVVYFYSWKQRSIINVTNDHSLYATYKA